MKELDALSTIEYDNFILSFNDMYLVREEEIRLLRRTTQSLMDCQDLAAPESTDPCIVALTEIFELVKNDLINRLAELYMVTENILGISEDNLSRIIENIETSVDDNRLRIREELTTCVGEMYLRRI